MRTLEPQRTWNWVFHPTAPAMGVLTVIIVLLGVVIFSSSSKEPYARYALYASYLLIFYVLLPDFIRPFTTFDSRAAERHEKIWNWIMAGTASFLLFGTFFQEARKALLGF